MKKYCFDTSGISNPLELMPEDIHASLWNGFKAKCLQPGIIAVTQEIYDEMPHIQGSVGQCIKDHKADLLMEVGDDWDWGTGRGSFINGFDSTIEPLPEPANLSVDAVAQRAKGSKSQFLKSFQRMAKLVAKAACLVLDRTSNDVCFRPEDLCRTVRGERIWQLLCGKNKGSQTTPRHWHPLSQSQARRLLQTWPAAPD